MKHEDLPDRWKRKLVEWIQRFADDKRTRLSVEDFPVGYDLKMIFKDESEALFKYAFTIEAPEFNEIGVFTEHCGYHIFSLSGTHVARIET